MRKPCSIDVYGLSLSGRSHDDNHDHFAIATLSKSIRVHQTNLSIDDDSRVHGRGQGHLFLVADGIGGGPAPARASGTAVDSVVRYFLNDMPWYHLAEGDSSDVRLALEDALVNCQEELLRSAAPGKVGMGTTMTLAFVFWPELYVAHVGDSRCYLSRKGRLHRLTTDHTLAELSRELGGPSGPRAEQTLWNAVGGGGLEILPEVRHWTLELGDLLALTTDGVTDDSTDEELARILDAGAPAEEVCERLVDGPGSDDRTAIVVRFLPPAGRGSATAPDSPSEDLSARGIAPRSGAESGPRDLPGRTPSPDLPAA